MLVHLRARGFRNLEPLDLELGTGAHLVLGDNGAGKTSLLEAVYLLATTRSFRTPRAADCVRHGESSFHLRGELDDRRYLEMSLDDGERGRSVNGAKTSLAEHLAVLPVVAWTVADTEVLTGPPAERRRFLDRGVVASRPAALDAIARHRRVLDGKRRLLQEGTAGDELAVWNQMLAAAVAELAGLRAAYLERLRGALAEVLELCGLGLPAVGLDYRPSPRSALDGEAAVAATLERVAPREAALGQPLVGCQRDELVIRWDGRPVRRVASAGERKALGLALLAAHGRLLEAAGEAPVYLLDDADTELDAERLGALWRVFGAARQLLATSNRPAVWRGLEVARELRCADGVVASARERSGG